MSKVSDRAAKIIKIVSLARDPMMDRVAVVLNCNPTYDECQRAREWEAAFEIASDPDFEITLPKLADEWERRMRR